MLKKIRAGLAIASIVCITALFLDHTGTLRHWLGWLPKIQFVPAILALNVFVVAGLIVATLLLGRVYCSVVCPLGIMQDAVNRMRSILGPKKTRRNRFRYRKPSTLVRVAALVAFIGLIVAGFTPIAALIEPYSAYGRIVNSLLAPVYDWVNSLLVDYETTRGTGYTFYENPAVPLQAIGIVIAVITLAVVGTMAWMRGREYCNTICPVGTVLGFLSRYAWLKPVIDTDACVNCGKCARNCKASCIDFKNHTIDYSRCVDCMDCIGNCSTGAISYTHRPLKAATKNEEKVDANRRQFVVMAGALATAAAVKAAEKTTDSGLAPIVEKTAPGRTTPIAPPGAVSLRNLAQHCTACQLCISECPNGVLRPSMEISSLMQPVVSYETGYCRPECTACSNVCPAGAIKPIDTAQKSSIQIGHAVVDRKMCISANGTDYCGNCSRHCPTGAITMVENSNGNLMPVINEAACIGCGACENLCPVSPVSAIVVQGHEVHRII